MKPLLDQNISRRILPETRAGLDELIRQETLDCIELHRSASD